ncbi:peptidoglycan DD-metalloendopeptidase family protein [Aquamicrobium sp. LC103]|uniref:peptidoglycan DD-metalloendopeptidase family protein n=1 Tax=Aquamicrobium sp. LC103 TaxID=1120658 RepID=UPI000A505EBF
MLVGGISAGCSSDVTRFQDSLLTGSTQAQASQPAGGYVDSTYTGSIRPNVMAKNGAPIPSADVQSGPYGQPGQMVASAPSYPSQYPSQPAVSSQVSSGSALAPVQRSNLDSPSANSQTMAQLPPPQQPAPRSADAGWSNTASGSVGNAPQTAPQTANAQQPSLPANQPIPGQAPDRLAVLPQQPKLKEAATGQQTASPATPANAGSAGGSYTVVAGDTLNGIARKNGVSAEALKSANGLSSGLIRIGQTLTIPSSGGNASVQLASAPAAKPEVKTTASTPSETPKPQVAAYTPPASKVIESVKEETAGVAAPDATGISRMRWPVRGRVIAPFGGGSGKANDGIDIAVPAGTPIKAAENGVVIYAGDGLKEFGNTVLVRHEDGLVTVYGHASEINVKRGEKVRRGQDIGRTGMTGSADTPKLHFEVRKDSTPVDPIGFLEG